MSDKTDSKRQYIIEKATEVFSNKGYKNVTMKDIVDACEISRGGLYLYYSSTEELFLDVVRTAQEKESNGKDMSKMLDESSVSELVVWFIKEQKKEILRRGNSLVVAQFEYAFACREQDKVSELGNEFDTAIKVLQTLIERGVETGEFECANAKLMATSMMYTIMGLKVAAASFPISEKKIDSELVYLMRQFMNV